MKYVSYSWVLTLKQLPISKRKLNRSKQGPLVNKIDFKTAKVVYIEKIMKFENAFIVKLEKYYNDDSSFNRWVYVILISLLLSQGGKAML